MKKHLKHLASVTIVILFVILATGTSENPEKEKPQKTKSDKEHIEKSVSQKDSIENKKLDTINNM